MSISSMCDRFTATLERQANTQDSLGGKKLAFSTANRTSDGVPTSVRADFQTMSSKEKVEYGLKDSDIYWCMYTASDPFLLTVDRVLWTDNSSFARVCRVVEPSFDMAGRNSIWKTIVQEMKNRT